MQDISKPIVAVRYLQTHRDSRRCWSEGNVGEMCEKFLDAAGVVDGKNGLCLSDKPYHYFTDIDVQPGDLVVVRGGDEVKLAMVDGPATYGTYRATRTVVAKMDFGPVLAEKRREAERQALTKEIERRARAAQAKEEFMSRAEYYAAVDPTLAEMLTKLKEMN